MGSFKGDWATKAESLAHGLMHYLEGGPTEEASLILFLFCAPGSKSYPLPPQDTSGHLRVSLPAKDSLQMRPLDLKLSSFWNR